MISNLKSRIVASAVIASMVATPVLAKSADTLRDLVGVKGSSGEMELKARGFEFAKPGGSSGNTVTTFWWNESRKDCIKVETFDGRYVAITDTSNGDCGKDSGSGGVVAAGVIGAAVLGAILLSRKDKNYNNGNSDSGYQQDWQQVEVYNLQTGTLRIFDSPSTSARVRDEVPAGTLLRNYGCEDYNGEKWCEVSSLNYRSRGWARDRYLRPSYGSGKYPEYGGGNYGGEIVEVYGVSNALTISSTPSKSGYIVGRINRGAQLRRLDCQNTSGEQWCRVTTLDGQMQGWARERYLRSMSGGGYNPGGPGYGGPGYGGSGYGGAMMGSISGIQGMDGLRAADELRARGFENVDSFSSGMARYGIYYYRPGRLCVQTTADERRILDIRDIGSHPRCR